MSGKHEPTIGFRPVDTRTPNDEWLLFRWKNTTTDQWMLPIVARGGKRLLWDGKRNWTLDSNYVQWCYIPGEAPNSE